METSFIKSYLNIDWYKDGESGTGNTLPQDSCGYPSGVLNRPIKQIFDNTVLLNERLTYLEDLSDGAETSFAYSSKVFTGNKTNDNTFLVLGSSQSVSGAAEASVISSFACDSSSKQSSVLSSSNSKINPTAVDNKNNFITSSDSCTIHGTTNSSYCNSILSSSDSMIQGIDPTHNLIMGSNICELNTTSTSCTILSSTRVSLSFGDHLVVGGYATEGPASPANITWRIDSKMGNIQAKGSLNSGVNFSDFAEMFESEDGEEIPVGTLVTLVGEKIRPARGTGDKILGVISKTAGITLGACDIEWKDKYLKTEFGEVTKELNPEYDPNQEYLPRKDRPEWHEVGLLGKVYVRCGQGVGVGHFLTGSPEGFAVNCSNSNLQVMKITSDFDQDKGYAIALALLK